MSTLPSVEDPIQPNWDRSALLTIDMQHDFASPDGAAFIAGTDAILDRLVRLVAAYRRARRPVLHVVRLYAPDGSNAERCRRVRLASGHAVVSPGSPGARLVAPLNRQDLLDVSDRLLAGEFVSCGEAEWLFYKPRWSAFHRTHLADRLTTLGVDTVVVAGCNFPNCPSATLFDATSHDFRAVLAVDAVSRVTDDGLAWCAGIGVVAQRVAEIEAALARTA